MGTRLVKHGPLQQLQTKPKLLRVIAPTKITSTLEAKDSQKVLLSAHYQQNIPPHLQPQSSISPNLGSPNHQFSTRASPTGDHALTRMPISPGPRITDGAGNCSLVANWTVPKATATFKEVRKRWTSRILQLNLHLKLINACSEHQADPFINDDDVLLFLQDLQLCLPTHHFDDAILPFQPFRLDLLHKLLTLSGDPDSHIAILLKEGIPSGAFTPLQPVGLWDPTPNPHEQPPDLQICQNNWSSPNTNPEVTRSCIQQEVDNNFVEEIQDIDTAERGWTKGVALGCMRRPQGSQIGIGFHHLWYEWALLLT